MSGRSTSKAQTSETISFSAAEPVTPVNIDQTDPADGQEIGIPASGAKRQRRNTAPVDTVTRVISKSISEDELLRWVIQLAKLKGWRVYHSRPGMNRRGQWSTPMQGDPGFCDLVMLRGGRGIAVELKREGKDATIPQIEWLDAFADVHFYAELWCPSDWLSGEIMRVLT